MSAALAPPPAEERTFSADDTDLEALFQRTEAVASSSAERKLHRPHARAKSEKRTPTATPTKAKKKRPPQATGSALPRDLSALQGDEAAIDREIRRLQDELRAIASAQDEKLRELETQLAPSAGELGTRDGGSNGVSGTYGAKTVLRALTGAN